MSWLALFVVVMLVVLVPTAIYERSRRSDYKAFVRYRKAIESQREDYHTTWGVK